MTETPREHEETNITNPVGKVENFVSKHFVRLLVWLAVSGGALALLAPWIGYCAKWTGEPDKDLRLHILYVTGGIIAVLGLVETHRKNTTDKAKANADIRNYKILQAHQTRVLAAQKYQFQKTTARERERIEADRAKNKQDHIRQVHAERRSRYTTAVEQLSSDKASIRLGGVYTLVGLVDEWLSDEKTTSSPEERHKEGQVIINNLCAYIRSPLPLAERAEQLDKDYAKDLQNDFDGDIEKFDADKRAFARDKATLEEERQVRQSIIKEIRERIQDIDTPGSWSKFDYDFSNAYFFYPIGFTNSYFGASSKFSGATFTKYTDFSRAAFVERAPFSEATFTCAPFSGAIFTERAPFSGAIFTEGVDFSRVTFTQDAEFSGAIFTERAPFSGAAFLQDANFSRATFTGDAKFAGATFAQDADFSGTKFIQDADFSGTEFTQGTNSYGSAFFPVASFSGATFAQDADFSGARFIHGTIFSGAEFTRANFSGAEFNQDVKAIFQVVSFSGTKFIRANFSGTEFILNADFSRTEFTQEANFSKATFQAEPIFKSTLGNEARFSYKADPKDYNFKVSDYSRYKIETEEKEYNGAKFIIPKGTELFDPDEPSEQGNNDDN